MTGMPTSTTISEGDFTWTFNRADFTVVVKYDELAFYRNKFQSVAGSKAVDIVALNANDQTLWLIEVKDYTRRQRDSNKLPLWDEVAQKARDTLAGILAASCTEHVDQHTALALRGAKKLRLVLHLEQGATHSRLFPPAFDPADVQQKLRLAARAIDPRLRVVDSRTTGMPWTSTRSLRRSPPPSAKPTAARGSSRRRNSRR